MIELSVTVAILQPDNAVRLFGQLFLDRIIRSGRIGNVQSPLLIKRARDWSIDQRWPRNTFHDEAIWHGENRFAQRHFYSCWLSQ